MGRFIVAVLAVLATTLVMEAVWFSIAVPRLYRPELGDLLATEVRALPAVLFYLLYPIAVVILAVRPNDAERQVRLSLGRGMLLGVAAYGAYELTNLATLDGWSELVTLVDIVWGAVLTSTAAVIATLVTGRIFAHTRT